MSCALGCGDTHKVSVDPHRCQIHFPLTWYVCAFMLGSFSCQPQKEALYPSSQSGKSVSLSQGLISPSCHRQATFKGFSFPVLICIPGLRTGKRLLPVELPAKHPVVLPTQDGDSCHHAPSRDNTGGARRPISQLSYNLTQDSSGIRGYQCNADLPTSVWLGHHPQVDSICGHSEMRGCYRCRS